MITEGEFLKGLYGMDNAMLVHCEKLMQKECQKRLGRQISSIDLDNGHSLVAETSYGDYPQIEVSVDGKQENLLAAVEYQDDDPEKPVVKTYFYRPHVDEVISSYSHKEVI